MKKNGENETKGTKERTYNEIAANSDCKGYVSFTKDLLIYLHLSDITLACGINSKD